MCVCVLDKIMFSDVRNSVCVCVCMCVSWTKYCLVTYVLVCVCVLDKIMFSDVRTNVCLRLRQNTV